MSYCRWSSDFGECDVYVYEDVHGGWTTHVAGRRLRHRVPDKIKAMYAAIEWGSDGAADRWAAAHEAEQAWRESLPCDDIEGFLWTGNEKKTYIFRDPKDSEYLDLSTISEFAGESFNDPTPGSCADRLEELRASGLNVPQYAIDALREEQEEMDRKPEDD